ncbi:MAG: glycoside hydrolase 15-like protein [Microgenomates group bacterium Gr01-1014_16]|nr:MAG: glycoside hydrolase 15-like protein [Microgenomates group bacterium Gr01-1014_16]
MARYINLSNGNLLIGLDAFGQVRDLYFPFVGLENHVDGHYVHRIGVWVDSRFSWIDDGSWQIKINYVSDTMASDIEAVNPHLQLQLNFTDIVYNERDIFVRKLVIKNLDAVSREVRIFFHQEFEIYQSRRGDTAYYDPISKVLIHYKGRRCFLINSVSGNAGFTDYSVGLFNIEGKEGTHKDAEDGILSQNNIEHGLVDSVLGHTFHLSPHQSATIYYWLTAAKLISDCLALNQYVLDKTPQYLLKSTTDFWKAWINRRKFSFFKLPVPVIDMFKKSLLVLRAHTDNRGGVIASGDSDLLKYGRDHYSYVWHRDAAFCIMALDKAGDSTVARRFFEFSNEIITPVGFFMHKYRSDQSLGSSWHPWIKAGHVQYPIQEDETAVTLFALWQHYQLSLDIEFIESIYNSFIKKSADFLSQYRDPQTGLPRPSYDLWEENNGVFTYTSSSVYGALNCAAKFAALLGKTDAQKDYAQAASEIQSGIIKYLYDDKLGYFHKNLGNPVVDSSAFYGILKFGVLEPGDSRLHSAVQTAVTKLSAPPIGGLARYESDWYFRSGPNGPGNPWIITSLWLAQYHIAISKSESDLNPVKDWLNWVVSHSLPSGILPEQLHPESGAPLSATPLCWSHAEFVTTVINYLEKLEELGLCPACVPYK